jgi:phage shock protein A
VQVKTQVATAITESRKLQSRASEKKKEALTWYKKAEDALQHNNETAARESLTRYNDHMRLAQRYGQQQQEQEQLVMTMRRALGQLETKIAEVETTIELLAARKRNAILQQRVYDALGKTSNQAADRERASRAQDAVIEAEARARAMADLYSRDLDAQLDQISGEELVEQQLNELKNRKRRTNEPSLLAPGGEHDSPLLAPNPQNSEPSQKRVQAQQPRGAQPSREPEQQTPSPRLDIEELKRLMEK